MQSNTGKAELNSRLETISWGLFLIMIGGLALAPASVPQGAWLLGAGIIMLGLNALRLVLGIRPSTFTVILGLVAAVAGAGSVLGIRDIPVWPILLIVVGLAIIVRSLAPRA